MDNSSFGVEVTMEIKAWLKIAPSSNNCIHSDDPVVVKLHKHVNKILSKFESDKVSLDDNFCCHLWTEVGLRGTDITAVNEVVRSIRRYVNNSEDLIFLPIGE